MQEERRRLVKEEELREESSQHLFSPQISPVSRQLRRDMPVVERLLMLDQVKMEKLEIMVKLCSERNVEQVLLEFKEYATEVDVDFVRKSVRAIGRCAIKLERAAERCINVLLELIQT